MQKLAKLPDGYKRDYNCKNNAKWDKHCEHLSKHCGTSLVTRMKCKHTCGSCKEKFPVSEPKDRLPLDSPEFLTAVQELYDSASSERYENKDLREAQSEDLLDIVKDVTSDSLLEKMHNNLKAVHELRDNENFANDETIELQQAEKAASQELSKTADDAEIGQHVSHYMQRMSSVYDDYFSVSKPGMVDDSDANAITSVDLSDVDVDADSSMLRLA